MPLLSLGGTSLVILSCAFGIILSVSRTIDVSSQKKKLAAAGAAAPQVEATTVEAKENTEDKEYEIMGPGDQFK